MMCRVYALSVILISSLKIMFPSRNTHRWMIDHKKCIKIKFIIFYIIGRFVSSYYWGCCNFNWLDPTSAVCQYSFSICLFSRPFQRTITMHKDSSGHVGFIYKSGKITSLVKDGSAARNGLLTDHYICEINGQNIIGLKVSC